MAGYPGRAVGLEWDPDACCTAVAAGHPRICADVATYPVERFSGAEGVIASPPCGPFSRAGKQLGSLDQPAVFAHLDRVTKAGHWIDYSRSGWADERSPLVLEIVRWISGLRPLWFACEQVEDVLPFWQAVARWARMLGYGVWCGVVSSEEFGVPQTRRRAILTGALGRPAVAPVPTHQAYRAGEPAAGRDDLFGGSLLPWVSMADALPTIYCSRPGNLTWVSERPATTVCGDARIGRPGHKDRDKGEAQFADQSVRVTIQEAATLQGFRPDYPWQGTKTAQYRQVGDAVCPPLAMHILKPLIAGFSELGRSA